MIRRKVEKAIRRHRLLSEGDGVVVAVSGGPDSVALLKIFQELSPRYRLALKVAHLNHGLRGEESDREESFVRELCLSLGLPFVSRKVDIRNSLPKSGASLEDACRRERYGFLEEVRLEEGFQKTALGHHRDDQAETVLMHLLRGSGPEGLRGMLPLRDGTFIRPMLDVSREEVISFLAERGLAYVKDSSNDEEFCLRNRIRHGLIPDLCARYNPGLVENLARTAEILRLENDFMEGEVRRLLERWRCTGARGRMDIPLREFLGLHEAIRNRVVKAALRGFSPEKKGAGFRHVRAVTSLAESGRAGDGLDMPFGVRVKKGYCCLSFEVCAVEGKVPGRARLEGKEGGDLPAYRYDVVVPGEVKIAETGRRMAFRYVGREEVFQSTGNTAFMDCAGISFPLTVRSWLHGDRIEPLGMEGSKKVHDIFVDCKVPREDRKVVSLLTDRASVIWVAGLRLSRRVAITERTTGVLKVEFY